MYTQMYYVPEDRNIVSEKFEINKKLLYAGFDFSKHKQKVCCQNT